MLKQKLIEHPILIAQIWELSFELMFDATDIDVWVILRKRKEKVSHLINYADKTLDTAQSNYIVIEKEMLALVFAFD